MPGSTVPRHLGLLFLCSLLFIFVLTAPIAARQSNKSKATLRNEKSTDSAPQRAPNTHLDLPVSKPPSDMSLESVFLFSRHGNRAADPIVEALCPKRQVLTDLYHSQQASYGALTYNGIRGLWDLGRFTRHQYVESNFLDATYTRLTSQIIAAASDRTLISASAFGQTCFNEPYAKSNLQIPVAVLTTAPEEDDMLEVRKASCANRLAHDLEYYDQNIAEQYIESHSDLISMISEACGFDIRHGPELTNGEFSVMQLVKDLSDALTGDMLEDFPLMDGVTPEKRAEFLQFAEDIFKARHYRTEAMDAYLSGNVPNRLVKLIDRRVSYNTNTTILDGPLPNHVELQGSGEDETFSSFRDVILSDAKRLPIIRPRPPRRFFAWHAHREVLYGFKNFLNLDLGVERPGLPSGLIHPSTGIFFELWQNSTKFSELIKTAGKEKIYPALDPNRKNSQRYLGNIVDEAFSVRILLWVPCFPGIENAPEAKAQGIAFRTKNALGEAVCLSRVRTLPQCDNLEFCPLPRLKQIIAENYNEAGGDFRHQCRNFDAMQAQTQSAGFLRGKSAAAPRARQFKSHTPHDTFAAASIFGTSTRAQITEDDHLVATEGPTQMTMQAAPAPVPPPQQKSLVEEFREEVGDATDEDSESFDDTPVQKRTHMNKRRLNTRAAGWMIGQTDEDVYNTENNSGWVAALAKMKPNKQ